MTYKLDENVKQNVCDSCVDSDMDDSIWCLVLMIGPCCYQSYVYSKMNKTKYNSHWGLLDLQINGVVEK